MDKTRKLLNLLIGIGVLLLVSLVPASFAQTPEIFDESEAVVGAQRTPTRYFYGMGKWSDNKNAGVFSTHVECYKRFGFCAVATAYVSGGLADATLDSFDILRWDTHEIIAVDSSSDCFVNTLRVDLSQRKVSLSSASKGGKKEVCGPTAETAFLLSQKDVLNQQNVGKEK